MGVSQPKVPINPELLRYYFFLFSYFTCKQNLSNNPAIIKISNNGGNNGEIYH